MNTWNEPEDYEEEEDGEGWGWTCDWCGCPDQNMYLIRCGLCGEPREGYDDE